MDMLRLFLRMEALAGLSLMGAAALALVLANSPWADHYTAFQAVELEVRLGTSELTKPLLLWINDGLMAIFFLLVGLELKREVLEGELSRPSQIVLPLAAAIGGVAIPSLVYWLFNRGDPEAIRGWAIPAATDIAFALGLLALLGSRVPVALRTFLMTLAVFDDLAAILIIAVFYSGEISWTAKGLALVAFLVLVGFNRFGITRLGPYMIVGAFLWVFVLKSGVHATLAGVFLALTIPLRAKDEHGHSPLHSFEHMLHPYVAFLILPVFAFANAGVDLAGVRPAAATNPVTLGIAGGLVLGKVIGTFTPAALLIRFGRARMPSGARMGSLLGTCVLAGVGFTMSLFIGTLAFEGSDANYDVAIRLGVLGGSLLAGILGLVILYMTTTPGDAEAREDETR